MFPNDKGLGLVENQSDWYLPGLLWRSHKPWPALGRGFNTGVILMNLEILRNLDWHEMWLRQTEKDLIVEHSTSLADQDIFNSVIRSHPWIVETLPCTWNLQLSENSRRDLCPLFNPGVIHFNSPTKMNSQGTTVNRFHTQFKIFDEMSGSHLKSVPTNCIITSVS